MTEMSINSGLNLNVETSIRSLFRTDIQSIWVGGTPNKIGDDPSNVYVAICEDENWGKNKCVLQDWFFDYEKCKELNYEIDCASYGVYVFTKRSQ